jgi:hypothetical protein
MDITLRDLAKELGHRHPNNIHYHADAGRIPKPNKVGLGPNATCVYGAEDAEKVRKFFALKRLADSSPVTGSDLLRENNRLLAELIEVIKNMENN